MPVVEVPAEDRPPRAERVVHQEARPGAVGADELAAELERDRRLRLNVAHGNVLAGVTGPGGAGGEACPGPGAAGIAGLPPAPPGIEACCVACVSICCSTCCCCAFMCSWQCCSTICQ